MKVLMAASLPGWKLESYGVSMYGILSLFITGLMIAEVVVLGMHVKG